MAVQMNPPNTWLHYEYLISGIWYVSEVDLSAWPVDNTNDYLATLRADPNARNIYLFTKGSTPAASGSGAGCLVAVLAGLFILGSIIYMVL